MDSAELYVACIYFKTSNSFSHTHPHLSTGLRQENTHCLCQLVLPAVLSPMPALVPRSDAGKTSTCGRKANWAVWTGLLLLQGQGTASLQSFHPSKTSSQLHGAKAKWSLDLQSPLSTHGSALSCCRGGSQVHVAPIPLPAHRPAPELMEMGGWHSCKALLP